MGNLLFISFYWGPGIIRQGEGEEVVLDGEEEVLATVELISHGGGVEVAAGVEVPEGFAGGGIESQEIAGIIGAEEKIAGGGEDAGDAFAVAEFVIPDDFTGAVVEGAQGGIGPEVEVAAAPAFCFAGEGEIKNTEDAAGGDVKEAGLRIEAGCHPIAGAVGTGLDERAVGARGGIGLGDGAAAGVNSFRPILVDEGGGDEMLTVGAIEEKEKTVAAGLGEKLARMAIEVGVKEDGSFDGVPVVHIVR